jgi:hypothetical protein
MSYRVDRYNGTFLTSVAPGTVDNTTDLRFIGQNYAGYGEVQNENFLYLLENFANTIAPTRPVSGQIWYDSNVKKLKFYDGAKFKTASSPEVSATPPAGLTAGDLWFDTTTSQVSVWTGSSFVLVGPQSAPGFGTSQIITQVVKDTSNASHVILRSVVGGVTTAIFSNDTSFTLSDTNQISGFSLAANRINKGITLNSVDSNGVSDLTAGFKFWGTATNAERLGGLTVDSFVRRTGDSVGFTTRTAFGDPGLTIGSRNDLGIYIGNSSPIIENLNNGPIRIRISNSASITDFDDMFVITRSAFSGALSTAYPALTIAPGQTNRINLGSALRTWKNIYSTNFYGNITGNVIGDTTGVHQGNIKDSTGSLAYDSVDKIFNGNLTGNVTGDCTGQSGSALTSLRLGGYLPSALAISSDITIPVRDTAGTITAIKFDGIASDSLKLDGKLPSINKLANTVALRNSAGDIEARFFNGTATSAQYADLAEIYKTDCEYDVGTVVSIGGEYEVTAGQFGDRAIGVISAQPAYLMNKDAEGQAVALKGRVPVKVIGAIKKGQRLVAAKNGTAIMATLHQYADVFAIAMETNDSTDVKLVESVIL